MGDEQSPPRVFHGLRQADRIGTLGLASRKLAHELGTPLNVIAGRATMISNDATASEEIRKHTKVILERTEAITARIREALDGARRQLATQPQSVGSIVDCTQALVAPLAADGNVTVAVVGDTSVQAALDPERTLQVLSYYVFEAVQAAECGATVTLTLRTVELARTPDPHCPPGEYACIDIVSPGTVWSPDLGRELGCRMCEHVMREQGSFVQVSAAHQPLAVTLAFPTGR